MSAAAAATSRAARMLDSNAVAYAKLNAKQCHVMAIDARDICIDEVVGHCKRP